MNLCCEEYKQLIEENIKRVYFYNDLCYDEKFKNIKNIIFINTDNNELLVQELFIKCVPYFKIYKNGENIENLFGTYKNIVNILKMF